MLEITPVCIAGFERVAVGRDPSVGYCGIIALHSLRRGPALGGSRFWHYPSEESALADALRLAESMSLKNAFASLPFGGGKAVICSPTAFLPPSSAILRTHGVFVESLGGAFVTGEDVGTTVSNMLVVRERTSYVMTPTDRTIDSAMAASIGVLRAIEGALPALNGRSSLAGQTVLIQGCGMVGSALAKMLAEAGARLRVCDVQPDRARRCAAATGARVVEATDGIATPCDIVAPCGVGGILDQASVARLQCRLIAGAANNQLASDDIARRLHTRGIVYVPDFVASAGGVIAAGTDLLGWTAQQAYDRIDAIRHSVADLLSGAVRLGAVPHSLAVKRAREKLDRY